VFRCLCAAKRLRANYNAQKPRILLPLLSFLSGYQDFLSYRILTVRGKIHICLDLRPLNFALQRAKLKSYHVVGSKVKVMSLCDAKEAFWMLKLDEESSKLTSFETQIGRYLWLKVARMEREKS